MEIKDYTSTLTDFQLKYKGTNWMYPLAIVWHETDNTASAHNEIVYMQKSGLDVENEIVTNEDLAYTSYHWAIDEKEAILGIPMDRNTWQSGDGTYGYGNRKCISIEICKNMEDDLSDYYKARDNCVELTAWLCYKFHIKPSQDTITRHKDYQAKNCPRVINNEGVYEDLVNQVKERYKMITELYKTIKELEDDVSELKSSVDSLTNEVKEINATISKRYDTLSQIKKELPWAFDTIDKLVKKGLLKGTNGKLDLTYSDIRILVINDRANLYQ